MRSRITRRAECAAFSGITLLICSIGTFVLFPRFDFVKAKRVATLIRQGAIPADRHGLVQIPREYGLRTSFGHAYFIKQGNAWMVLFPTWRTHGANLTGYLYSSMPIEQCCTHRNVDTTRPVVKVLVGDDSVTADADVPVDVLVDRNLGGNWYEVSRGED
jgi:hypothetical protein